MGWRLHHAPASPYVRKVMVVLHEADRADAVAVVPAHGTPVDSAHMPVAHNPLGKIPALERDDGPALYDSRVICRYLDAQTGAGVYPAPPRLWDALTLEATGDGIMDAAVLIVYEGRVRAPEMQSAEWVEGQWAKIARALDTFEGMWLSHLAGPVDIGQIATGCALGYLDFRMPARDWRAGRPGLAAWYAGFAQRPAMLATGPAG